MYSNVSIAEASAMPPITEPARIPVDEDEPPFEDGEVEFEEVLLLVSFFV